MKSLGESIVERGIEEFERTLIGPSKIFVKIWNWDAKLTSFYWLKEDHGKIRQRQNWKLILLVLLLDHTT